MRALFNRIGAVSDSIHFNVGTGPNARRSTSTTRFLPPLPVHGAATRPRSSPSGVRRHLNRSPLSLSV